MRDPGLPRRNPFFDHASDPDADETGPGFRVVEEAPDDEDGVSDAATPGDGLGALLGVVQALGDAQPDAAEHLVAAAHEWVLAVKVVVDATESALADQRAAMAARRTTES